MKPKQILFALLLAMSTSLASADVQSLTSNELTETYIEDSTIIVTPAQTQEAAKPRRILTYTISPSEPLKDQRQEHSEFLQDNEALRTTAVNAEESARQFLQTNRPMDQRQPVEAPIVSNRELNLPNVPPIELPRGP